jgi:hypothetical protein
MARSLQNSNWRGLGARAAAGLLVMLAALLGTAASAHAQSECVTTFERWSKLSASRTRAQPAAVGQEACLPSEGVRADLLQALAKSRSLCDGGLFPDQATKQTKDMIDINSSVITSMPICRPVEQPAKAIEPEPTPSRPRREEQAARPREEQAAKPIDPDPTPPRPPPRVRQRACLDIAQAGPERFVLANRKCTGSNVLAVIEKRGPSGKTDCKAYTINRQLQVGTARDARPQINYECVLREGNCTKDYVATIFPECDW